MSLCLPLPLTTIICYAGPKRFVKLPLVFMKHQKRYKILNKVMPHSFSPPTLNAAPSSFNARGTYLNKYGNLTTKAAILLSRGSVSSSISSKPNLILT